MHFTEFRYATRLGASALLLGLASFAAGAQTLSADTPVLASPDPAAKALANLRAGAPAKILKRQGFWLEIESGAAKGWVRISTVKLATPAGPGAIDTGRLGAGNIVATSAARGLSAKDLLEGKSDEKAVDRLAANRPDAKQVAQFAQEGALTEVKLTAFLQAPPAEAPAARAEPAAAATESGGGSRARRGRRGSDEDM